MDEHRVQFPDEPELLESEEEQAAQGETPMQPKPSSSPATASQKLEAPPPLGGSEPPAPPEGPSPPPPYDMFYLHDEEDDEDEEEEEVDDFEDDEDNGIMMKDKTEAVAAAIAEHGIPPPPDGGWGWVIVAASFMCFLVIDGCTSVFGILLPDIVNTFQKDNPSIGRSQVAWAGSLLGGFSLCIGPVVSALTNKYGCRCISMTGSVVAAIGFVGASYAPNLPVLLLTYGFIGGIGVGLLYLPAIVCVGYYFESKRALATGIALSGSGIGAIAFAPIITALGDFADWRTVCLGFAGCVLLLAFAGALMRPLEIVIEPLDHENPKGTPLLQRMAHDKKHFMEKASYGGSDFFMVQLPDGSMEKRPKMSLNVDPGVHSVLYLDQLVAPNADSSPLPTLASAVDILPTITEAKPIHNNTTETDSSSSPDSPSHKGQQKTQPIEMANGEAKSLTNRPQIPPQYRGLQKQISHHEGIMPPSLPTGGIKHDGGSIHSRTRTTSNATDIPQTHNRRERRHSEGGQSPTKTGISPNYGASIRENKNLPEIPGKRKLSKRVSREMTREGASFTSKGSEPMFSCDSMTMSSKETGVNVGVGGGDGTTSSILGHTPRERKYSIRAIPSTASFGQRKNSFESGQFKSSVSNMRDSRSHIIDDDYRLLLSKSEFSTSPFIRKLSIDYHRKPSTMPTATGVTGTGPAGSEDQQSKFIIRPMSRKDLFYSGSIHNLPEYQAAQDLHSYHQSIINIAATTKKDEESQLPEYKQPPPFLNICPRISKRAGIFKTALCQMLDVSLLKNPVFLAIALSAVFGMLGFFVPLVYVIDSAVMKDFSAENAAIFISIIGLTSTVGRIGFGLLSDLPWVNSLFLYNCCILIMGLSTFLLPFCMNYYWIAFMYVCFGSAMSGFIALSSIVLVDLLGLENLTNAFGLLIFFRGISSVLGTPLSGAIFDSTGSYDIPFWLAGIFLIIAALISFMIPFINRFAPPKPIIQPRKPSLMAQLALEDIIEETVENGSDEQNSNQDEGDGNLDHVKIAQDSTKKPDSSPNNNNNNNNSGNGTTLIHA